MNDLPIFPDAAECMTLWPMWLLCLVFGLVYLWSLSMERQMRRWHRMARRASLKHLEQTSALMMDQK